MGVLVAMSNGGVITGPPTVCSQILEYWTLAAFLLEVDDSFPAALWADLAASSHWMQQRVTP
jgi:hypothetical protein